MSQPAIDGDALFWEAATGFGKRSAPIDPCENDYEFVERYRPTIDGQPFDWDRYSFLVPVYQDTHPEMTMMCGAQVGKSVRLIVALLRQGIVNWGHLQGYYFPDFFLPREFSKNRFRPFAASSEELKPWLGAETAKGKGTDQVLSRSFGESVFYFLSVAGKTTTEGLPMAGVYFDEVRRMGLGDIQRGIKRTTNYEQPVIWRVSTARYPESDIHAAFLAGDQRFYHSDCDCDEGIILAKRWPDCVMDLKGASKKVRAQVEKAFADVGLPYLGMDEEGHERWAEACYRCPECGKIIADPRDGWWQAHNPEAYAHSWHIPQLLIHPAGRQWKEYAYPDEPLDLQEFWNSNLGLPHISDEARYCRLAHILGCVRTQLQWAANQSRGWKARNCRNSGMGIDQMGEFNCVTIKTMTEGGKHRTVHVEVTHGDDTWRRCAQLMAEYDVRICVSDQNPNFNDARRFAKTFQPRVFLVTYNDDGKGNAPMIAWRDSTKRKDQKGIETRFKWIVTINKSRALEWSLSRWKNGQNEIPDLAGLMQKLPVQSGRVALTPGMEVGQWQPVLIARDVYADHMTKFVKKKLVTSEEHQRRGDVRYVAEYVGAQDPHFALSNLFADMAVARIGRARRPKD